MALEEVMGTVRPKTRAVLESKVSGRIQKLTVNAGQVVKEGDLLAQLEVREIEARLEQAKALREQALRDRGRYEALLREKVATQAEFEAMQSRYLVAEANLAEAQTMLGYAVVKAPFDGVISRKLAEVGDLAVPGKTLLEIESRERFHLEADIPEALISRVPQGGQISVRVSEMPSNLTAKVSELAPSSDPNSRTFRVKLDLPQVPGLRGGQFGRALVPVGDVQVLLVPAKAVVQRGQLEIVFVADGGQAHLRLVKSGKRLGEQVEILSGLSTNETVVIDNPAALVDGQPLQIER